MIVAIVWGADTATPKKAGDKKGDKVVKTEAEWRKILTPEQFRVTRKHGTERAFTGAYWHTKDDGIYRCVCCGEPLSTPKSSSIREPAGPASGSRSTKRRCVSTKTTASPKHGRKSFVTVVTPTWDTFLTMGRHQPACGIA